VAKGLVFIGNGGAEYGVRGYVSAYDAETGALKWRFYTVPGDPAKGPDHAASDPQMAMAAKTWTGQWWKYGGGGTVWDSIVYDPELDQLYIGVGNGSPWNRQVRSPGGGDNLFLSSIVALDPDDGHYLWHYQTTPGETWDFTATQQITLATLKIDGQDRKVLMQAPKNGFFYVIDRTNGKLISAKNFVPMAKAEDTPPGAPISWAYGVDMKTGRPMENEAARYTSPHVLVTPAPFGAHNWHPMSFDPETGLVYLPAQELPTEWIADKNFVYRPGRWNTATSQGAAATDLPADMQAGMKNLLKGYLLAWDPVTQKEVWRAPHNGPWNGGTLSTAGGLVFQGTVDGKFNAYDAKSGGDPLWSFDAQAAPLAGPITYEVGGEQYVAVVSGYGSVFFLAAGFAAPQEGEALPGRVLVFKLGGKAVLPKQDFARLETPEPPAIKLSPAQFAQGAQAYGDFCAACHGIGAVSGGVTPDLRRSLLLSDAKGFDAVVLKGERAANGMPNFGKWISASEATAIRAYIAHAAKPLYDAEQAAKANKPKGG
jgi:quinohemoprotein ethanol dehydrogenase